VAGSTAPLLEPLVFEWDAGNVAKSREKHGVLPAECEELFGQQPILLSDDLSHSGTESRHLALGRSRTGRRLFVAFTIRDRRIRVISARDMSRKERRAYDAACEE
jgi:uncharacterized protein